MNRIAAVVVGLVLLVSAPAASGQVIAPLAVGGPARVPLQALHPPSPVDQVVERAMRQQPALPVPAAPAERLVPERRVLAPEFGRQVVVPSHYETRISDQLYAVPPLAVYETNGGLAGVIPGGTRPPADIRQGP
jgi:hypothetical protein